LKRKRKKGRKSGEKEGSKLPARESSAMQLGEYLRQIRRSRRLTLAQLGATAGVSLNTLSRWETGVFQPRLAELEAALRALGVVPAQWERALALMEAPRAVVRLREEAQERQADLVDLAGHAPAIGDLLRAMRLRRRMTLEQAAIGLGVTPRSVRRWEGSETVLPEERLDDLCRLLGAMPEERLALSQQRLRLWSPEWERPLSLEAVQQQCYRLVAQMSQGNTALMDLRLLCLEAQLWPQAARSQAAQRALAHAFTTHAQYLLLTGRSGEVQAYSDRALDLVVGRFAPEHWWFLAAHATGVVLVPHQGALRNRRRVEYLRRWLDCTNHLVWQTGLYRDMAQYASESGHFETALDWIRKAEALAERLYPLSLHLTKHIHARVLLAAGRANEALLAMPSQEAGISVHQQLYEANQRVEVLQALGDHTEAHDWLNRAYTLCREHSLSTEGTDALARRF
jgi:transcriptional regulator with XRE-family HTH domain